MMSTEMRSDIIQGLCTILGNLLDSIILYGSYARNQATEESDIDIAIILNGNLNLTDYLKNVSELGSYINDYIGLGLNFKYSSESEYNDELNYIGPKFRYRVNYSPRNTFDMDIYAGLGYGWYRFKDYYYDYYNYSYKITETMNYIVPNIGVICYLNVSKNLALGFEPGFMWYISTDLEKSHSVGVWNLQGKIKFTF